MERREALKSVIPNLMSVVPEGWIKNYMSRDLEHGFIGNLDILAENLIVKDDIYGKNRRGNDTEIPDLGILETDFEAEAQYAWWNCETQSNWLDGFIRTSVMLRNKRMINKAKNYMEDKLKTQDEDGYLGIYKKDLRYMEGLENGELWAQATLIRALFAYYEYTKDKEVLDKIKSALDLTMRMYAINESRPFSTEREQQGICCGGLSHGLAITDVYLKLYRITKEEKYLEYCVFLYENYCQEKNLESDITFSNLKTDDIQFRCHGVHTYEHLRALIIYSYTTGKMEFLENCLGVLDKYLNPSGAPTGDEWIFSEGADPTVTGYEYCSIHELLHSYCLLLQVTGMTKWADRIEWLLFNAGRGSHHPEESAIAYLKSDNSYSMKSVFQVPQPHCSCEKQTRYKYSPVHQDVAVCCVPNAGRIMPYYLQNMWHCDENGFTKMLYGPSVFEAEYNNSKVRVEEISNYPIGETITMKVSVSQEETFTLRLRKAFWWESVTIQGAEYVEEKDFLVIRRKWSGDTKIHITYKQTLQIHPWKDDEYYFSYGANVLALQIAGEKKIKKQYLLEEFEDTEYFPQNQEFEFLELPADIEYRLQNDMLESGIPLWNRSKKIEENVVFVPMGNTILRKVTLKKRMEREQGNYE